MGIPTTKKTYFISKQGTNYKQHLWYKLQKSITGREWFLYMNWKIKAEPYKFQATGT